jgi:hypothetical protein
MTEPPPDAPTPEEQAADAYARLAPYEDSFNGVALDGEWANTVTVTTVALYDPTERPEEEAEWAADYGERQLVRVDTNYKPARLGQHPVDLGRAEAAGLAAAVLEAIEDTLHYGRVGELRAAEAAELLSALDEVDYALAILRSHALGDLCKRIGIEPDA